MVGGTRIAGIGGVPGALPRTAAWTVFFGTADIDTAVQRVEERAGTLGVGPRAVTAGRVAIATDPQGARFGLWQGAAGPARHLRVAGAPHWVELVTADAFAAAVFYGTVLDWDAYAPDHLDVHYEHDRVLLRVQGHDVAALRTSVAAVPAWWEAAFAVSDTTSTADHARTLGPNWSRPRPLVPSV